MFCICSKYESCDYQQKSGECVQGGQTSKEESASDHAVADCSYPFCVFVCFFVCLFVCLLFLRSTGNQCKSTIFSPRNLADQTSITVHHTLNFVYKLQEREREGQRQKLTRDRERERERCKAGGVE